MLKYNYNHYNNTIVSLSFSYKQVNIDNIKVNFYDVKGSRMFVGNTFENVRQSNTKKFTEEQQKSITEFLNNITINQNKIELYDLLKMSSSIDEINNFIGVLQKKVIEAHGSSNKDISKSFGKKKNVSATEKELTDKYDKDYFFKPNLIKDEIKKLIFVDDVFNRGRTLNQLLIRLAKCKKITSDTKIEVFVIYTLESNPYNVTKIIEEVLGKKT